MYYWYSFFIASHCLNLEMLYKSLFEKPGVAKEDDPSFPVFSPWAPVFYPKPFDRIYFKRFKEAKIP